MLSNGLDWRPRQSFLFYFFTDSINTCDFGIGFIFFVLALCNKTRDIKNKKSAVSKDSLDRHMFLRFSNTIIPFRDIQPPGNLLKRILLQFPPIPLSNSSAAHTRV